MYSLFIVYSEFLLIFLFSPMPIVKRLPGLLGGAVLTIWWLLITRRSVQHTINKTSFVKRAFIEDGKTIGYGLQAGMRLFEKSNRERLPFPKIYIYVIYGAAPLYLILDRLLSERFGSNGILIFMEAMGMPVSLWFAGLIVRIWLVMVALPWRIQKERGKPVVAIV